ncbi:MAG: hypothetical protein ACT4O6_06180 [Reyranella sp.]
MPTDKERRMLIRPLMKRRPDLQYHRQWIFMKPLTHYLRAVLIISGWYGRYFRLESMVVPLFAGTTSLHFRRTKATLPPEQKPFCREIGVEWLDDPERSAQEVSDIIEHEAFPPIADLTSPEALDKRPDYSEDYIDPALGACFNGDFDRAERLIVEYVAKEKRTLFGGAFWPLSLELVTEAHRNHEAEDWRIAYLGKLLQKDRSQVPGLLHEWEEVSVNALKLNKYWTRTPFPCDR